MTARPAGRVAIRSTIDRWERPTSNIVSIHQAEYLPYPGFFHKMIHSDVFIYLMDVQFNDRSFQHRQRIRTPRGWTWLTIPVRRETRRRTIAEVEFAHDDWVAGHLAALAHSYGKCPNYGDIRDLVTEPYETVRNGKITRVADLNVTIIGRIARLLGIDTDVVRDSDLGVTGVQKGERILELVRRAGGTVYLSGTGARDYLDPFAFRANYVALVFSKYDPLEPYRQRFDGFEPRMSILDMIANLGPDETRKRLCKPGRSFYEGRAEGSRCHGANRSIVAPGRTVWDPSYLLASPAPAAEEGRSWRGALTSGRRQPGARESTDHPVQLRSDRDDAGRITRSE